MEATILTELLYKTVVEEHLKAKQAKQNKRDEKIGKKQITLSRVASNRKSKCGLNKSQACETEASKTAQQQSMDDNTTYHCLVCGKAYEEAWIQSENVNCVYIQSTTSAIIAML